MIGYIIYFSFALWFIFPQQEYSLALQLLFMTHMFFCGLYTAIRIGTDTQTWSIFVNLIILWCVICLPNM
mgnify:CR=1 FL=1